MPAKLRKVDATNTTFSNRKTNLHHSHNFFRLRRGKNTAPYPNHPGSSATAEPKTKVQLVQSNKPSSLPVRWLPGIIDSGR
jgi:hypothetical protein